MEKRDHIAKIQQSIILVLAVLVLFAFTGSVTLAIYTRFEQDSTTITFGPPVAVYISDSENNQNFTSEAEIAYPGTTIDVNLWFGMEFPSSEAYIRAQFNVSTSVTSEGEPLQENLIEFTDYDEDNDGYPDSRPNPENWVLMDFNFIDEDDNGIPDDPTQSDYWYVFATQSQNLDEFDQPTGEYYYNANTVSNNGVADNQEIYKFIEGKVVIGETLTNEFANSELTISFLINAIQTVNFSVPIDENTAYYANDGYVDSPSERIYVYDASNHEWPNQA